MSNQKKTKMYKCLNCNSQFNKPNNCYNIRKTLKPVKLCPYCLSINYKTNEYLEWKNKENHKNDMNIIRNKHNYHSLILKILIFFNLTNLLLKIIDKSLGFPIAETLFTSWFIGIILTIINPFPKE